MISIGKFLVAVLLAPFLTLAFEPSNPTTVCDRFIGEEDQRSCTEKMKSENVDWYAVAVCSAMQEDSAFWQCWEKLNTISAFAPTQLGPCAEDPQMTDSQRLTCLESADAGRKPASQNKGQTTEFQPLKIKKK